ncbi:16S rRNA (uracil(1498)-N(3))-methyltransferase [Simiduia agarivorans]|uniref:Ribosomal RNA small subunit methyltransferase E n=1 Tax=Simiduia agarivorans (strain DSM 21679 / JCM 13881 / BCRC 17597 / SA1) TaxID=1117647 RepID=K4KHR0_SIMAS|nr:16S rRNA (uracil(1498)-N(3))-methyltransferase [Simiduia agarivorans]AFU97508.1 16S ribosomal RNA methyltransferase RsmE [Simiduia agarivorans SA1 = DSM 21679]
MNLLLLTADQFLNDDTAQVSGRQARHIVEIHRAELGQRLRVGRVNGCHGQGIVTNISADCVTLSHISLDQPPPTALPLTLLLAMPRPKMLRRLLQTVATMGVKKLVLHNAARVEKSFWQTPFLQPASVHEQFVLGLEQARDTVMPELVVEKRFRPFVEDRLPDFLEKDTRALVAHPYDAIPCPVGLPGNQPVALAIGPEGGYVPFEIDLLKAQGFSAVSLGERILRVETAVPVALARLFN